MATKTWYEVECTDEYGETYRMPGSVLASGYAKKYITPQEAIDAAKGYIKRQKRKARVMTVTHSEEAYGINQPIEEAKESDG